MSGILPRHINGLAMPWYSPQRTIFTMHKHFISANELLLDAYRLAKLIYDSGFVPDCVVGVWRGGTPVAIAVEEFLAYQGITTEHAAIKTASYTGINQQGEVQVSGLEAITQAAQTPQRLLIVDDVFDSGRSITAILSQLRALSPNTYPQEVKIACPWYKPTRNVTQTTPDFYVHTTDNWLVFPHELIGLSKEDIYEGKGKAIAEIIFDNNTQPQKP